MIVNHREVSLTRIASGLPCVAVKVLLSVYCLPGETPSLLFTLLTFTGLFTVHRTLNVVILFPIYLGPQHCRLAYALTYEL